MMQRVVVMMLVVLVTTVIMIPLRRIHLLYQVRTNVELALFVLLNLAASIWIWLKVALCSLLLLL
jgi:uncharacterized protein with PQ loop repeat